MFDQYATYTAQQLPFIWMPNAYTVQAVPASWRTSRFNPLGDSPPRVLVLHQVAYQR